MPAWPASAHHRPGQMFNPFKIVMAGEAGRTSNGENRVRAGRKQP
jgi:hypothetical protein